MRGVQLAMREVCDYSRVVETAGEDGARLLGHEDAVRATVELAVNWAGVRVVSSVPTRSHQSIAGGVSSH